MISETCCECGGSGKNRIDMAFGHVDATCSFCNGTGKVAKRDLFRAAVKVPVTQEIMGDVEPTKSITDLLNESMVEVMERYKRNVEQQLYAPSPIMQALTKSWVKEEGSDESAVRP